MIVSLLIVAGLVVLLLWLTDFFTWKPKKVGCEHEWGPRSQVISTKENYSIRVCKKCHTMDVEEYEPVTTNIYNAELLPKTKVEDG